MRVVLRWINSTADLSVNGKSVGALSASAESRMEDDTGHVSMDVVASDKDATPQLTMHGSGNWDSSSDVTLSVHQSTVITDVLALTSSASVNVGATKGSVEHSISVTSGSEASEQFLSTGIQTWDAGSAGSASIRHDLHYPHSIPVLGVNELSWSVLGDVAYASDGVETDISIRRKDLSELVAMRMLASYGGALGDG